ncbi:MAG TPA: glycosyltransferase [Rhodocyclaceae bacterium]|nr:glycosyltransferase [Rhodocyclaceae bacterium]HMV54834.1 glycosyltransferase [Rhodocyclaceae bacterium]HMZ84593.1 glycosyltransferase [Rhodocyclaceae bacterium]HNA03941.1 glycosyltransferase [Rhodocyclaceae bacterium]HNB78631.1 glycosyltransferase [Rhodocyclaceae bacterium]
MNMQWLDAPAPLAKQIEGVQISRMMHLVWMARPDLRSAFDLDTEAGQRRFADWFQVSAFREYGITPAAPGASAASSSRDAQSGEAGAAGPYGLLLRSESAARSLGRALPALVRKAGVAAWQGALRAALRFEARMAPRAQPVAPIASANPPRVPDIDVAGDAGVTLVGYARAEIGMGEHVRMTAATLEGRPLAWGIYNYGQQLPGRQNATADESRFIHDNRYKCNLFHVNADQMLLALLTLGRDFFDRRYNIGYWAWELAHCPEEWDAPMSLVDELWAPSRFIQSALAERARVRVEYMPLCVELPQFAPGTRAQFGLPDDAFLFLYTFDFLSYVDRKNPLAAVRAFRAAFPTGAEKAGLVLKAMNADESNPRWRELQQAIDGDPRIAIINRTFDRHEVLQLFDVCDCFVSLHRSEGFGRGPAEAMYLGKPVILTDYSGTTDFANEHNACPVRYRLVPVGETEYVFPTGQEWADPDAEHAAWHMKRLAADRALADAIGARARATMREGFNATRIGDLYERRLRKLGLV